MYLLDTNVISELRQGKPKQSPEVRAWAARHAAILCAALQAPNPRSYRDAMIAATALEHAMTVVTRNLADFAGSGVKLINPFEP
ncbi:MAG: hypothetical protein ACKVQK_12700 [Burkholderiales bacterium]